MSSQLYGLSYGGNSLASKRAYRPTIKQCDVCGVINDCFGRSSAHFLTVGFWKQNGSFVVCSSKCHKELTTLFADYA